MIRNLHKHLTALAASSLLAFSAASLAQSSTATLQGTVSDSSGAIVPAAQVNIVDQATGLAHNASANADGFFSAPNLPAATYKVTVAASGFGTSVITGVVLSVGEVHPLDVHLAVAAAETTVTVTSSSNQVNNVDTSVQGLVDGKQTRDLPLNGRDWTSLATLNPGVSQVLTQYPGAATATTRLSRGLGAQMTIGGNRPQGNSYRLDGVNINDYANGGPGSVSGVTLGVDAVQEFSVITSDAPAQYGRMSGGVINSISRSGASKFHGSAYDFLRNSYFDARSYFDPLAGEPSFRRNQLGGTIGGPVIKDRTFFFFNFETFRQAQGVSMSSTVLSPNARAGLVTCTGNGKQPCDVPGTTTPAPSGTAGQQQLTVNAAVVPFLTLFPPANGPVTGNTGQYNFVTTQADNENFATLHMDHTFSQKDSLHGTLLYDTGTLDSADATNTLYDEAASRRTTASIEEVHIFTPRFTNSFRLGYNRSVAIAPFVKSVLNPAVNNPALGFYTGRPVGQTIVSGGLTTVQGGSGSVGTNAFHYNSYQLYDDATYVIGHHSITFGGTVERDMNNTLGGVLPNGEWSFGSINNFLTNVPAFFEGGTPATPVVPHDLRQTIFAAYAQDSWQLRPNLTANLGLRYEMATNTTETANRLGSLSTTTSAAAVSVKSFFSNNPTLRNFEPRIGISWSPYANGKTVFSASSGIYDVLPLNYLFQLQVISSAPSYQEGRVTTGITGAFPITPFYSTTPLLREIYTPRTPPRSYVIQSNVSFQQQLSPNTVLNIGYITSHGVHQLFSTNDINNVPALGQDPSGNYYWPDLVKFPVTSAARAAMILNPAVGTESDSFFAGSSIYNSLQASLSYSSPKGITGKVAYTWSHSIDDSSSQISGASYSNSVSGLPSFNLRLDRANSDFDLRNVFSANAVAPIPDIRAGGIFTSPLRHWSFNNIINVRGGIPMTPLIGGDPLGLLGSQPFDFPDRIVNNRPCTNPHNVHYIDTTCFAFPTTYNYAAGLNGPRLGTGRRNTLQGPGLFFWTTGIMRDQPITETVRAQFQFQMFNASNHTNFASPASSALQLYNVSGALSSTAGLITGPTATSGRQLQFALKLMF